MYLPSVFYFVLSSTLQAGVEESNDDRTLAEKELGRVVTNPQPFYESERAATPVRLCGRREVSERRDNEGGRS
jgi:hypothetical protein